jgi:hypothetical protein
VVGVALAVITVLRIALPAVTAPLALINVLLGVWLVLAPSVLAYGADASRATTNDIVVGTIVALLAAVGWFLARFAAAEQRARRPRTDLPHDPPWKETTDEHTIRRTGPAERHRSDGGRSEPRHSRPHRGVTRR